MRWAVGINPFLMRSSIVLFDTSAYRAHIPQKELGFQDAIAFFARKGYSRSDAEWLHEHIRRVRRDLHTLFVNSQLYLAHGQRQELTGLHRKLEEQFMVERDPTLRRLRGEELVIAEAGLLAREAPLQPNHYAVRSIVDRIIAAAERHGIASWQTRKSVLRPSQFDREFATTAITIGEQHPSVAIAPDKAIRYICRQAPAVTLFGQAAPRNDWLYARDTSFNGDASVIHPPDGNVLLRLRNSA